MKTRTYGSFSYCPQDNQWIVADLEPHVSIRFKQLFPRVPKHSAGPFALNAHNDTAADLKWFTDRYPLQGSEQDRQYLIQQSSTFFADQAEAEKILLPSYTPSPRAGLKPGQALRKYQLQALDLVEQVRALILVDDIGLGKTYEGLGVGLLPGALPLVIVMEPHLQSQWLEKAQAFTNFTIHAVKGNSPYSLPPADVYLFKYTQLGPWVDVLTQGWVKAIVFDEIQQLRTGEDSGKGKAAAEICRCVDIRVGLTATPIYNYGIEAFNIVEIIRPGLLGTRQDFLREWCTDGDGKRGVVKDPDALGAYLREALVFLRRTKRDVGQEAKQAAPHVEWVEPNAKDLADSEALAESLALRTLTSTDFFELGQAARELDLRLREMTGIAKAKATASYVRMFIEAGTPVLLFGWHREVYRIWAEELADLNPRFYTGSETPAQKDAAKRDFIDGRTDLLIMSLRSGAGADGIQYRCSTAVFGEFDWSPKVHEQCVGRLDRDGQDDDVFAFYVATNYGSDPVMIDVLGLKAGQSRGIVDPGKKSDMSQVQSNRVKLLAEAYLQARGKTPPRADEKAKDSARQTEEQLALL